MLITRVHICSGRRGLAAVAAVLLLLLLLLLLPLLGVPLPPLVPLLLQFLLPLLLLVPTGFAIHRYASSAAADGAVLPICQKPCPPTA